MKTEHTISRIILDEVVVPANADSVNSPELDHPLHMLPVGGKSAWSVQFDAIPKVLIRIETDSGLTGIGEAYRGVGFDRLVPIAEELLGLRLDQLPIQNLPIPKGRVYDGFECAVIDAFGKMSGLPAYQLLGGKCREKILCSFWTGHRTVEDAARKAREAQEKGFSSIKFKCASTDPVVAWCRAILEACGPDFHVILDPNQRFENPAVAARLAGGLHEVGNVLLLEDPIARWDLLSLADLKKRIPLPIALHIACPYNEMGYQHPADVIQAVRLDACDYFNFNGGFFEVKRMATVAELASKPFWHGSEVDLGILEASYLHKCAACPAATLPSDIFGEIIREDDLIKTAIRFEKGYALLPDGDGLGVELDLDALKHYRTATKEITS